VILTTALTAAVAGNIRINNNAVDLLRWQVLANLNAAKRMILASAPLEMLDEPKTVLCDFKSAFSAYQWPADYIRFVKIWVRYSANSRFIECRPLADDSLESPVSLDRQGTITSPKVGLNLERGYVLQPTPAADVSGGIRLRYIYDLPDMSDTQDCLLDVKWRNLLEFKASELSAAVEGSKPDLVTKFGDKFTEAWKLMIPKVEPPK